MKAKTILSIVLSNLFFWFGLIGLFWPYELSFLTHKQNTMFQALCIVIGAGFIVLSIWSGYKDTYKKYREFKFTSELFGKKSDDLAEQLIEMRKELNRYKTSHSQLVSRCKESDKKLFSLRGNFTQLQNKYNRKKDEFNDLNKKYADLNVKYSVLKSKNETHITKNTKEL